MRKLLVASLFTLCATAQAAPIVLDFEGVTDASLVANFYSDQGVIFDGIATALVDQDFTGTGNFANEPSANTVMFYLSANQAFMNVAAGFSGGFSFFYSSFGPATVRIYDGLSGTGNLLGTISLSAQRNANNCVGDPNGAYCNWTAVGMTFIGTAKSVDFSGTANNTGFDDITIGSATPGRVSNDVPEPGALALAGLALVGAGLTRRRR